MTLDDTDFSLAFSRALGNVIVHVHGAVDENAAPELHQRLIDAIDGQGNLRLVLDLRAMTLIDTAGLSVLVDALRRMQQKGGELVLSGPTGGVVRAIAAAGLDTAFVITAAWAHPAHGAA